MFFARWHNCTDTYPAPMMPHIVSDYIGDTNVIRPTEDLRADKAGIQMFTSA